MFEIFLGWLIFSGLVAWFASNKGRSAAGFFFLALVISPLIAFLVALLVKDLNKEREHAYERQRDEAQRAVDQQREREHRPESTRAPSRIDELERLAALRDKGVLTDDEFAQQKAVVLAAQPQKALTPREDGWWTTNR